MRDRILAEGSTCGPLLPVTRAFMLVDGVNYYRAFVKAAEAAENYILMAGWQFDSEVLLLRGDDNQGRRRDCRLGPYLESLCRRKPNLRVYILAWDYTPFFGLDREWFQDILFSWRSDQKIQFEYDNTHPVGASHHQKMVCIDGDVAFVGGMDICSSRWDDRRHLVDNPERRNANGKSYEPYHDMQACVVGEPAAQAARIFAERWSAANGEELLLPQPRNDSKDFRPEGGIEIRPATAAFSRTAGRIMLPEREPVMEIKALYVRAILEAESLIYMENQYFTSRDVFSALMERMNASDRTSLQIILILPMEPHAPMEKIAMGQTQARMIHLLRQTAREKGHTIGIFYTKHECGDDSDWATYIHAKLLIVDDRFMSVGSANTNNRSMGLDTELNISFEEEGEGELAESLTGLRIDLLREHSGITKDEAESLRDTGTVADTLLRYAGTRDHRLRNYITEEIEGAEWMNQYLPEAPLDPGAALVEEYVFEAVGAVAGDLFSSGILALQRINLRPWLPQGRLGIAARFISRRWPYVLAAMVLALLLWMAAML